MTDGLHRGGRAWVCGTLVLLALLAGGCANKPTHVAKRMDVEVTRDPSLRDTAIEVDLVGVNPTELERDWKAVNVSRYFEPGNKRRQEVIAGNPPTARTLRFPAAGDAGPGDTLSLSKNDPIWKTWKDIGALYLVVLARLPASEAAADKDPRRLVLPLDKAYWPASTLKLVVSEGRGVMSQAKMKPVVQP